MSDELEVENRPPSKAEVGKPFLVAVFIVVFFLSTNYRSTFGANLLIDTRLFGILIMMKRHGKTLFSIFKFGSYDKLASTNITIVNTGIL